MENLNVMVSDKWTQFTKELVEATEKIDTQYPVAFNVQLGNITLIDIKPKDQQKVAIKLGSAETGDLFEVNVVMVTYEWEEKLPNGTTKKRTIKLPNMPNLDMSTIFTEGAKLIEIAEGLRKFLILQIMTRDEITRLNIPGTGILLADQLTNSDGISKDLDALIKKVYNVDSAALNNIVRNYDMMKFGMGVKDKLASKMALSFVESLKFLAEAVKQNSTVQAVQLEKTGVDPSMVKQQDESIRAITSIGEDTNKRGIQTVL